MARLRSPFSSISRTNSQVSTSDEMSTSVFSRASPPEVRLVRKAVIPCSFKKSIRRISMVWASRSFPRLDQAA